MKENRRLRDAMDRLEKLLEEEEQENRRLIAVRDEQEREIDRAQETAERLERLLGGKFE